MQSTQKSGLSLLSNHSNGQWTAHSIQTLTLDASNDGIRYTPVGAGIKIDDSSGDSEILITQILSEQALFDSLTVKAAGETIGNAGALLYEDGVPVAWNPANPNVQNPFLTQTILAYGNAANGSTGLLDNDTWGGLSGQAAGLTVSGVDLLAHTGKPLRCNQSKNAIKSRARCAGSIPGRGRKCLESTNLSSATRESVPQRMTVRTTGAGFVQPAM
jgi:hypothetical protein